LLIADYGWVIELKGVSKSFGSNVILDVDLTLHREALAMVALLVLANRPSCGLLGCWLMMLGRFMYGTAATRF